MHLLETKQKLPVDLKTAWEFFSSPDNLKEITPEYMGFDIISVSSAKMYPGMIIRYKVRPMLNFPIDWVTEITHVSEHEYFVDEQRFGPYKFWHHTHRFIEINGGVEMSDTLYYKIKFGIIGRMANGLFVRRKLKEIFDYRFAKIEEILGKYNSE
ncbi:MAG: SRPBCC family protein [Ignavibacteria bacterium]|nr:SRPBCC family protein [Ignavibacteria bacterium]